MKKKRVMVVDDDTDCLEELKETLISNDYNIILVSDSTIAFDIARIVKPDLIVLDLKMNVMDGFQVAGKLNEFPETASIPVIAISAYFNKEEHFNIMRRIGVKKYISKPFNPADLINQIEIILAIKNRCNQENSKYDLPDSVL